MAHPSSRHTRSPSLLATPNCAQKECAFEPSMFSIFGGMMQHNTTSQEVGEKFIVSPNWAAPDKRLYWNQRLAIALLSCDAEHQVVPATSDSFTRSVDLQPVQGHPKRIGCM